MRDDHPPPCIVVGIDGSRSALEAALWAVDEAVSRDIPLRLVYAIDPGEVCARDAREAAHQLATAETAVRYAVTAVESTDKLVKIEVDILQARPLPALLDASRSAAMVCVGSIGLKHFQDGRIGSTAAALASAAHCPVAIIGGHDPLTATPRCIAAEVDKSDASDSVLRHALDEARLRGTPLDVLTTWQSRYTDIHDHHAVADGNRRAKAALQRRLQRWRKLYPDLDIRPVALHSNTLNYLATSGDSIQLLIVGHERGNGVGELLGASGRAALRGAHCAVLICEPHNVL